MDAPHPSEVTDENLLLEEARQKILANTHSLLYEWEDEIPNKVVNEGPYKIRWNWWQCVCGYIALALEYGLIRDEAFVAECQQFIDQYAGRSSGFTLSKIEGEGDEALYRQRAEQLLTNRNSIEIRETDITRANQMLSGVIEQLKCEVS